ncbi:homoserine O-acetyltransferase MetX [Brevibacterium moorei]|jgi:homoserine O-acetyltransferase|uniref:homoserine O-acetyltransferase MetX n=1 Tax=Brevibacterium moorei TaxID=2968457 RepID=UPI00211C671A|nr:homoserine O-acetyltransferase [Brevibacterium sp. 68QC2CO]MCQ9384262.1 homoserine O-acetyltransferase [Brevibacterium sp. 68QC2CO]
MVVAAQRAVLDLEDVGLDCGAMLPEVRIAYETFGTLNADASNAILIEHALTGDSHVTSGVSDANANENSTSFAPGWWEALVGPGRAIDTNRYFVVCSNALGGCTGSTGPTSFAPDGLPYGGRFPSVSVRDQARVELALSDHLGIGVWDTVIGGSMGGARALEFILLAPQRVRRAAILAAPAYSLADQIAWAHAQVQAIQLDPDYCGGDYLALGRFPKAGLGLARQIAHLTYRADAELNERFERNLQETTDVPVYGKDAYYSIQSYLDHQARKLVGRFDAQAYIVLTNALRDHDIRRGRGDGSLRSALAGATQDFLVLSMSTDRLYPPQQVLELAQALPGRVDYATIPTRAGHDGFLTEAKQVGERLRDFLGQ